MIPWRCQRDGGQGTQIRLFLLPQLGRWLAGFAMDADIGDGIEPLLGGGVKSTEGGQVETGEEVFFNVAHAVFHPALFIALAHIARRNGKAHVVGKVSAIPGRHLSA